MVTASYINPEIFDKFLLRYVNNQCPRCAYRMPYLVEILKGEQTDTCRKCGYIFPKPKEDDYCECCGRDYID